MAQNYSQSPTPWRLEPAPCDFCGETDADVRYCGFDRLSGLPGRFAAVVCRRCGLVRTNPQPTPESLSTAYPVSYPAHQPTDRPFCPPRGLLRWLLVNFRGYPLGRRAPAPLRALAWPWAALCLHSRRLRGYLPYHGEGRLLDFGCGAGHYVRRMTAAGWKAEGLDLLSPAVQAGREAGLTIHHGTLPGADLPAGRYDVVTMWHALEHVPSPLATLRAAHDLLRPGGRLLVAVPLADCLSARLFGSAWYGLDMPRHLTHFTTETLRRHLASAGFRVERLWRRRRPGWIRGSFRQLADATGRPAHRLLARSRLLAGGLGYLSLLVRQADEAAVIASRV